MDNKKMITISLLLSMAIILSYIERMIPTPFLIAGAKLGLTNIITITTLVLLDRKSSFIILMMRITLVSLLFAGFSGFLYSMTGGLLSYIGMSVVLRFNFKEVSLVGISVIGAVLHSLGQVLVAMVLFSNSALLLYLPLVLLTSLITGIFIGLLANHLTERLLKANII